MAIKRETKEKYIYAKKLWAATAQKAMFGFSWLYPPPENS